MIILMWINILLAITIAHDCPVTLAKEKIEHDFIIVGAGPAGSALAARLSELRSTTVLLLEAGGEPEKLIDIPYFAIGPFGGKIDWASKTVATNTSCQAHEDRRCPWDSGKGLGGTTLIQGMVYTRGLPQDYDNWAELGNKGWSYKDVLPYFRKAENYLGPINDENRENHGVGGPITLSRPPYKTELAQVFLDAGKEIGYKTISDITVNQIGFFNPYFQIKDSVKVTAYSGYLEPALHRENLNIITEALVVKVLFDGNKRAIGVEYEKNGERYTVKAKKEVIVSAGAKNSPQILTLSGIGPKNILEKFKIDVVHESEGVGKNLKDHVSLFYNQIFIDKPVGLNRAKDVSSETLEQWETKKQGPLTVPTTIEAIGFLKSKFVEKSVEWPDIEFLILQQPVPQIFKEGDNITPFAPPDQNSIMVSVGNIHPKSIGYTEIASADPHVEPIFQPNYFGDDQDLEVIVQGLKLFMQWINSTALQKYGAVWYHPKPKECEKYKFLSDDYLKCHIRLYTSSLFHPSGTCKMGTTTDKMAVVDNELQVYGVTGLRVVDISISPDLITGHTIMPAYMMGEKIAEAIKKKYNLV